MKKVLYFILCFIISNAALAQLSDIQPPDLRGLSGGKAILVRISEAEFGNYFRGGLEPAQPFPSFVPGDTLDFYNTLQYWWIIFGLEESDPKKVLIYNPSRKQWLVNREGIGIFSAIGSAFTGNNNIRGEYLFDCSLTYEEVVRAHNSSRNPTVTFKGTNSGIYRRWATTKDRLFNQRIALGFVDDSNVDTNAWNTNFRLEFPFDNSYVAVPFYGSSNHSINIPGDYTQVRANSTISDNKAVVVSYQAMPLSNKFDARMFKVDIDDQNSDIEIGLIDYKNTYYKVGYYRSNNGNRKPTSGIKIKNGKVYLFSTGQADKLTSFNVNQTIYFGYTSGKLNAFQGSRSEQLTGVPTPLLLNKSADARSRLLCIVKRGNIKISYSLKSILFLEANNGEMDNSNPYVSTDPKFGNYNVNKGYGFDWTAPTYNLRYKSGGSARNEVVQSPFYSNTPRFSGVANKYSPRGEFMGGADFDPGTGWELIKADFGYDNNGAKPVQNLRNEPYMILYNRTSGKLRVFLYLNNTSIANNLRVSIKDGPNNAISQYRPAKLWGGFLQGKALNDNALSVDPYNKTVELNSSSSGAFVYADFTLTYDPCIQFFESNLQVEVHKVTSGTLKIVGRTLGGSVPAGSPSINDWLSNSDDYLTGVLDTPYGSQQRTLGDVSFRNFTQWGGREWRNEASFVQPGKKIQQWERDAARLQYQAEASMASAEFLNMGGKILKGSGKVAGIVEPPFVKPGKALEAAGEYMEAAAAGIKGGARIAKAHALKLRWQNLKDTPDRTIPVTFPEPQPSVVFSELALNGTISISTKLFDDVIITTPGSKNSDQAPSEYRNGSKGAYPVYNERPGLFNMLYKPEITLVLATSYNPSSLSSTRGARLVFKKRPYLASNMNRVLGHNVGVYRVRAIVTNYDSAGNVIDVPKGTKAYSFTYNRDRRYNMPDQLDISELIAPEIWSTIRTRYNQDSSSSTSAKINNIQNYLRDSGIKIELEIEAYDFFGKNPDGTYLGSSVRQSFDTDTEIIYKNPLNGASWNNGLSNERNLENITSTLNIRTADIQPWGNKYIISDIESSYATNMRTYCNSIPVAVAKTVDEEVYDIVKEKKKIKVFPNPSGGEFNVSYTTKDRGEITLTIIDLSGRVIVQHKDISGKIGEQKRAQIQVNDSKSGIYLLMVRFKNGESYSHKIMVKK